jgi:RimJ/RimL family protein N-acetyltransferase
MARGGGVRRARYGASLIDTLGPGVRVARKANAPPATAREAGAVANDPTEPPADVLGPDDDGAPDHPVGLARPDVELRASRLEVRPPTEADRPRFVELFCDDAFMVFSAGALGKTEAHARFDRMLANAAELNFAKQPVIERSSGLIVGYAGVDWFDLGGQQRLEFGYRLVPEARGKGYATEASRAVLAKAAASFRSEILAIIDPINNASQGVARKLGFRFWKQAVVDDYLRNLYTL